MAQQQPQAGLMSTMGSTASPSRQNSAGASAMGDENAFWNEAMFGPPGDEDDFGMPAVEGGDDMGDLFGGALRENAWREPWVRSSPASRPLLTPHRSSPASPVQSPPTTSSKPLPLAGDSPAVSSYDSFDGNAATHGSTGGVDDMLTRMGVSYKSPQLSALSSSPPNAAAADALRRQTAAAAVSANLQRSPSGGMTNVTHALGGMRTTHPVGSPTQQGSYHGPSPLGRYYLAKSDPNHVSHVPAVGGPTPHQPVIPNLPPVSSAHGTVEASPTLSLASDDTLRGGLDAAGAMFPAMSRVTSRGLPSSLHPHLVPLPPSPVVGGPRGSFDGGLAVNTSPLSKRLDDPPSMDQTFASAAHRKDTSESLASSMSTSSEEEDLTSPMILPDVSMARRRPSFGSPRYTTSPRSPPIGSIGMSPSGSAAGRNLFGPIPPSSAFTFQVRPTSGQAKPPSTIPRPERPGFPPMSSSSSDPGESDEDFVENGSDAGQGRTRQAAPTDAEGKESGRSNGGYTERPDNRSRSITVGGSGYTDTTHYGGSGNGGGGYASDDSDSDDDDDGKRRFNPGKPIDQAPPRKNSKAKDGEQDSDGDDDDDYTGGSAKKKRKHDVGKGNYSPNPSGGRDGDDKDPDAKKKRRSIVGEGDVVCDYVELEPPYQVCNSHFHRTYDLQRHRETIHARNEGRLVARGKLKLEDAKQYLAFGQPQIEWPCPHNCGQIFSRKDAMQRHVKTKHQ